MAYGGNPSTDTSDALRLRVWDTATSTANEILSDAEVTFFLNNAPSGLYAAADAADAIAAKFSGSGSASEKRVGDLMLKFGDSGNPAGSYRDLANQLRMQAALSVSSYSGGVSISDKDTQIADTDWNRGDMQIGMHDNNSGLGSTSTGDF